MRHLKGVSKRVRKIWWSVVWTVLGLAALSAVGIWIDRSRDTDLADASDSVSASLRHVIPDDAPRVRFLDVAAASGIDFFHGRGVRSRILPEDTGSGVAWGDVDGDGDPDLYCVNIPADPERPSDADSNRLYRNDGGRFVDITDAAGVGDAGGFGMSASFADIDGDGDQDLYVTNWGPNRLFRNRGDGTFDEVGAAAGVDDPSWSAGVAWGDVDRDGDLDLYVCNYLDYDLSVGAVPTEMETTWEEIPFALNPNSFDSPPNRFYRNRGDGTFEEVAAELGVDNSEGRSLAATFCDLDGDGWLDLYVNNDVSANALFRNRSGEASTLAFIDLSAMTGTADPRGSMGLSVADVGGRDEPDGLPDLFITHWVAQENAFYQSFRTSAGHIEYRDRTRRYRLGEISTDTVGWGCAFVDFDLDGRFDLAVANGSTLELADDPGRLKPEPLFLLWNRGEQFVDLSPNAGPVAASKHVARGLAAADYDGDGDVDLAITVNRGALLLLRNDTASAGRSLTVELSAPDALRFGARVCVRREAAVPQTRFAGCDVSYLSMHERNLVFGLGADGGAWEVEVQWADGRMSRAEGKGSGRVVVTAEAPTRATR